VWVDEVECAGDWDEAVLHSFLDDFREGVEENNDPEAFGFVVIGFLRFGEDDSISCV
jgi:hypothetical protein